MTETILNTVITSLATVLVALVGVLGARMNGRIRRVQSQVENSHSTNLREELDKRHDETREWFELVLRRLVNGDERMGRIESSLQRHESALGALEDTLTPKE